MQARPNPVNYKAIQSRSLNSPSLFLKPLPTVSGTSHHPAHHFLSISLRSPEYQSLLKHKINLPSVSILLCSFLSSNHFSALLFYLFTPVLSGWLPRWVACGGELVVVN